MRRPIWDESQDQSEPEVVELGLVHYLIIAGLVALVGAAVGWMVFG